MSSKRSLERTQLCQLFQRAYRKIQTIFLSSPCIKSYREKRSSNDVLKLWNRNNGIVRVTFSTTSKPQTNDWIGAYSPANTGVILASLITGLSVCNSVRKFLSLSSPYSRFHENGTCEVCAVQCRFKLPYHGYGWPQLQLHESPGRHFFPLLHR